MVGFTLAIGTPVFRRQRLDANINTVTPNSTELRGPGASAINLDRRRKTGQGCSLSKTAGR